MFQRIQSREKISEIDRILLKLVKLTIGWNGIQDLARWTQTRVSRDCHSNCGRLAAATHSLHHSAAAC